MHNIAFPSFSLLEPMKRKNFPTTTCAELSLNFLGPLPSGDYLLVLIDYYTRFMGVRAIKIITAEATTQVLEQIFVTHGYPRTIQLDNAKQFVVEKFENFCKNKNIHLRHSAPYWPQANAEVERQNSSLLDRLRISNKYKSDW